MKKILIPCLLLVAVFFQHDLMAQKAKYQSIFIYNFTKYVKWPNESNNTFIIGVLGNSDVYASLVEMSEKKKEASGGQLKVVKFNSLADIGDCHILFVPERESSKLAEINAKTSGKNILVITEKSGLAEKGSVINFIEEEGKLKFELNQAQAEIRGLKVSGSLISLAKLV
ncbi:MAG: YfiR family protein [Cyclobacteriaceae bacterium]